MKSKEKVKKILLCISLMIGILALVLQVAHFFNSNVGSKLLITSSRIALYISVVLVNTKLVDKKNNWFSIIIFGFLALLEIVNIFI